MKIMQQKMRSLFFINIAFCLLVSCSSQKQISKKARTTLLDYKGLAPANIGISIFDAGRNKFLYNYQAEKYFTPASNVKLFTLYAGLKYLDDSIVAARFALDEGTLVLQATGDPTFLHPDFKSQPLLQFLQRPEIRQIRINTAFAAESFGSGWSWDDYKEEYMAERDPFPMYGNVATVIFTSDSLKTIPTVIKPFFVGMPVQNRRWEVERPLGGHIFTIDTTKGTTGHVKQITMAMGKGLFASRYLADTLHKEVINEYIQLNGAEGLPFYSQSTDSLFKIMMHRSDNFFAEQTLLMASNEKLGEMNDKRMIDTLLKTDLQGLPQRPRWVDGSGLSRYNLFSPRDFIYILNKLKDDFTLERLKVILPGADEGTLAGLYKGYEGHIYAKTGTLSNNIALSGFLVTRKNRTLIFSIQVNNHMTSATGLRKQFEKLLTGLIDTY